MRGRGRSKKSWKEVIKYDLKFLGLLEDLAKIGLCGDLGSRLLNIGSMRLVFQFGFYSHCES